MRVVLIVLVLLLVSCQACFPGGDMALPVKFSQFTGADNVNYPRGVFHGTNPSAVHFIGTTHRRTFIAYQSPKIDHYDEGCDPYLVYYDWDERKWYGAFKIGSTQIPGDDHSGAALFIDENNKLHAFYGSHGTRGNQQWTRSTRSLDSATPFTGTDDFETPKSFGDTTNNPVTYPQVVGVVNNKLVIFLRGCTPGTSHSERESWWESSNYAGTWADASFSKVSTFIDSGDWDTATVYLLYRPVVDSNGDIHVAWFWYNEITKEWYNTLYARYDVSDSHWEKADGTVYSIPITLAAAEVVDTAIGTWAENIDVDETCRPYISNGNKLYVWETDHWAERTPPAHISLLEVVSSNLLYIYTVEDYDKKLYRYKSIDRGVNFTGKTCLGNWGNEILGVLIPDSYELTTSAALAKATGGLPTLVTFSRYIYSNEPTNGRPAWEFEVGQLWAACLDFPYVAGAVLSKNVNTVLTQENGKLIDLSL